LYKSHLPEAISSMMNKCRSTKLVDKSQVKDSRGKGMVDKKLL
jgi:hypothetical protein